MPSSLAISRTPAACSKCGSPDQRHLPEMTLAQVALGDREDNDPRWFPAWFAYRSGRRPKGYVLPHTKTVHKFSCLGQRRLPTNKWIVIRWSSQGFHQIHATQSFRKDLRKLNHGTGTYTCMAAVASHGIGELCQLWKCCRIAVSLARATRSNCRRSPAPAISNNLARAVPGPRWEAHSGRRYDRTVPYRSSMADVGLSGIHEPRIDFDWVRY